MKTNMSQIQKRMCIHTCAHIHTPVKTCINVGLTDFEAVSSLLSLIIFNQVNSIIIFDYFQSNELNKGNMS